MEDREIITLYFRRDERAIRETQDKYGRALGGIARNILGSPEDAEECVNDCCFACWNAVPPKDPSAYFYAFLAKITRSLSIDRIRERSAEKRSAQFVELTDELLSCIPCGESVEREIEDNEFAALLNRFLKALPEVKRTVFVKRYFYMDPVKQIAADLGMSESRVKMMLLRTREELKEKFTEEGYTV